MDHNESIRPRGLEWTALHEAGHRIVALAKGIAVTRISFVATRDESGRWLRGELGDIGTGVDTTGTHSNGEVRAACARDCLAIALAGTLTERVFRNQGLPESLALASILEERNSADLEQATLALAAIQDQDGVEAIADISREAFALLQRERTTLHREAAKMLGWVLHSAQFSERDAIRIEGHSDHELVAIRHRWRGLHLAVEIYPKARRTHVGAGDVAFAVPHPDGGWKLLTPPTRSDDLHLGDRITLDPTDVVHGIIAGAGHRTLRIVTQRTPTIDDFVALAAAGAIVVPSSCAQAVTLSAQLPDVRRIQQLLASSSWAGPTTVQ